MRLKILYKYHTLMSRIKYRLWRVWHSDLRWHYDGHRRHTERSRPWYHMCCNGNAGGWRTDLCDHLENYVTGWRRHDSWLMDYDEKFNKPKE